MDSCQNIAASSALANGRIPPLISKRKFAAAKRRCAARRSAPCTSSLKALENAAVTAPLANLPPVIAETVPPEERKLRRIVPIKTAEYGYKARRPLNSVMGNEKVYSFFLLVQNNMLPL